MEVANQGTSYLLVDSDLRREQQLTEVLSAGEEFLPRRESRREARPGVPWIAMPFSHSTCPPAIWHHHRNPAMPADATLGRN